MNWRALLSGSIALVVLQVILTSPHANTTGLLFRLPGTWARWLIDPAIPAIPNLAGAPPATESTAAPAPAPGAFDWSTTTI